jgi:hypothetical protein
MADFLVIPITIMVQIWLTDAEVSTSQFTAGLLLYPVISLTILLQGIIQVGPIFIAAIG